MSDGDTVTRSQNINPDGSSDPDGNNGLQRHRFLQRRRRGNGVELWKSDGTHGGRLVQNIATPRCEAAIPRDFEVAGNTLFFAAETRYAINRELWKTDGNGASVVFDLPGNGNRLEPTGYHQRRERSVLQRPMPATISSFGRATEPPPGPSSSRTSTRRPRLAATAFPRLSRTSTARSSSRPPTGRAGTSRGRATAPRTAPCEWRTWDPAARGIPDPPRPVLHTLQGQPLLLCPRIPSNFQLWKIADTIPPVVTIDSGPAEGATLTSGSPTFGFSSNDSAGDLRAAAIYPTGSTPPAFGACSGPATHTRPRRSPTAPTPSRSQGSTSGQQ